MTKNPKFRHSIASMGSALDRWQKAVSTSIDKAKNDGKPGPKSGSATDRRGRNDKEYGTALMLRRLKQLSMLYEHCLAVVTAGKRRLSGKELYRVQMIARQCAERAATIRDFQTDEPDVPDIKDVEL